MFVDLHRPDDLPIQILPSRDPERSTRLMAALDGVNGRFGRDTLRPGGTGPKPQWGMRRARLSPAYITRLEDVLEAQA